MSQMDSCGAQPTHTQTTTNMIPLDIMFVIDRSGSMETMGDEVYKGFNTFVATQQQAQKQNQRTVRLTTVAFDDEVEIVHDRIDITKVPLADDKTFEPRGMTALFDAVGKAIVMVNTIHKQSGPSQVIVAILTDGEENSSRHVRKRKFNQIIQRKRKEGWEFVFLAANQDAIRVGGQLGFNLSSCLTYGADETSCRNMMGVFSQQVQRSISVPNSQIEFSHIDREVSIQGPAANTRTSATTQPTPEENQDSFECSQLPEESSNDIFAALPRISRFAAIPETQVLPDAQHPDNALQ